MSLDVYASLQKEDTNLKRLASLSSLIFSAHYFLLGAIPGALSEILNGTRTIISAYTQTRIAAFFFLGINVALLFAIPYDFIQTLPFISSLSITIGLFFYQGIRMRFFYLLGWALWLIYSTSVFSLGGMIVFTVLLVTTLTTIIRLWMEKRSLA